ncbi:MAG: HD domain-containing protein, partial [Actinomycetota bacterium]|nr:HD domain-containing protein [Actinomycetota bacterium]
RDIEAERYAAVMLDLAGTVDLRFSGSARHSETVGRYAEMMARELGLSEQRIDRIRLGGLLHDIGKVDVPDSILNKRGRLSAEEFETIRTHPALGAQILEHPCFADIRQWSPLITSDPTAAATRRVCRLSSWRSRPAFSRCQTPTRR